MPSLYLASMFLAAVTTASPAFEIRQNLLSTQAVQTLQVTKIDWQRSSSTINGLRFQATLAGTGETWRCTSSDSASGEGFAPTKIDRCVKGSPITFSWNDEDGNNLRIWLSTADKSYVGSVAINPPSTDSKVVSLKEIEATPSTTPQVNP